MQEQDGVGTTTPPGQGSADSMEERVTNDTSGVMELRGNMEPVGISWGTTREPMMVGGWPQVEEDMKNRDKHKESTMVITARSTA